MRRMKTAISHGALSVCAFCVFANESQPHLITPSSFQVVAPQLSVPAASEGVTNEAHPCERLGSAYVRERWAMGGCSVGGLSRWVAAVSAIADALYRDLVRCVSA